MGELGKYARAGALLALFLSGSAARAQWPWKDLDPGRHPVGYRVVRQYDRSRTFGDAVNGVATDRLIEIRIWYPAASSVGTRMPYAGYRDADGADGPIGPLSDTLKLRTERDIKLAGMRFGNDTVQLPARLFASTTGVVRNAPIAAGPFPAIVAAPGRNDASDDNAVLWEYLASHGYVVGLVASQGLNTVSVTQATGSTEAGVRDMEFALAHLLGMREVDGTRIGTAGFSLGGLWALVLAMRNARVRGVVGLDPAFIFERTSASLRASPLFDSTRFATPLLVFAQRDGEWAPEVIEALRAAPRFTIRIAGMDHTDFSSYGAALRNHLGAAAREPAMRHRLNGFVAVATYVRDFLDAFVKGDEARALAIRSKPRWGGVKSEDVDFSFRLGAPVVEQ